MRAVRDYSGCLGGLVGTAAGDRDVPHAWAFGLSAGAAANHFAGPSQLFRPVDRSPDRAAPAAHSISGFQSGAAAHQLPEALAKLSAVAHAVVRLAAGDGFRRSSPSFGLFCT